MPFLRHFLLRTKLGRVLTLVLFVLVMVLALGEIVCQIVFAVQVRGWEEYKRHPAHYYQNSSDPVLGYELKRNYDAAWEGRTLHLNKHGIRENTDDLFPGRTRIALVGDSVTFSTAVDGPQTVSARLQELLDPVGERIKVLNFGCPGYGLGEMPTHLHALNAVYKPQVVIYLLNPNDFSLRNTVYEGADTGLYRMYHPPTLKLPAAVKKIIYRLHKGGALMSAGWYAWLYNGTKDRTLPKILEMRDDCRSIGADFRILMLPTRTINEPKASEVRSMYTDIAAYAKANNIRFVDSSDAFAPHLHDWLDDTDHNTVTGCQGLAETIRSTLIDEPLK